jgi:hypothetical protein
MTTSQKNAIPTPATGLMVYDTDLNQIQVFNGTWGSLGGGGSVAGSNGQVQFNNNGAFGASSNLFWDNTSNSLGIETTTPTAKIEIVDDLNASIKLTDNTNNANVLMNVGNFDASLTSSGRLFLNGSTTLSVSSTNVGIGVASPTLGKLHVVGDTYVDGPSTVTNRLYALGGIVMNGTTSSNSGLTGIYNQGAQPTYLGINGTQRIYLTNGSTVAARIQSGNTSFGLDDTTPARVLIRGSTTANGTDALLVEASDGTDLFEVENGGLISVGKNVGATTQSTATIQVKSGDTNTGLALVPKGEGAITAQVPDGTTTGGSSRGAYSVDLQMRRVSNVQVASGSYAALIAGFQNRVTNSYSGIFTGLNNGVTSGRSAIIAGEANNVYGTSSVILGGNSNTVNSIASNGVVLGGASNEVNSFNGATVGGSQASSYLPNQIATSGGSFSNNGDNQTSDIRFRALVTGTATDTLFLDGVSQVATLSLTGTTNARVWNARIQCVAIVTAQGNGTVAAGLTHSETYDIVIKRTSAGTVIVGSNPIGVIRVSEMSTASFTVDADTTNNALRIRFTPPSGAGSTTTIRAAATAYLTELGY